jgi:arylsulfatase A-like enzyme
MKNSVIICIATLSGIAAAAPAADRPNILLILTDDLGYADLGCYSAEDFATPNIDRIAESGVRFTDGYVTSPQCAPSRAGLMSGLHPLRFGFIHNSANSGLPDPDVALTLPEKMREMGYTTGLIGKWHVGYILDPSPDRYGYGLPGNEPWERGFDYVLKHHGGGSHYFPYSEEGSQWMRSQHREPRLQLKRIGEANPAYIEDLPPETYLTDYFSAQAVEFIREHEGDPWFLFLSYNAPHTPMNAKPELLRQYAHIPNNLRRTFVAMMHSLDEGVGEVLDALVATGQLQNTLVWFLSDNGAPTHQNASRNNPFSGRKGDIHEGGIRVPFIVSWPAVIPGKQVLGDPVMALDILPTSIAAAGAKSIPEVYDGENLMPWLSGATDCGPNAELFWRFVNRSAVRIGDLKETRNGPDVRAVDGSTVPGHIFVNLRENPAELPEMALQCPESRKILETSLDNWIRRQESDQQHMTAGLKPLEWDGSNIVFSADFEPAYRAGGNNAPIQHQGGIAEGFLVSPLTAGPGIQLMRLDETFQWDHFVSEVAGTNPAVTLEEAVAVGAYFELTLAADTPVDFTGLKYALRGYGNRLAGNITARSSADGFREDLVTLTGSLTRKYLTSVDLSGRPEFSGLCSVTFRFYLYDEFSGSNQVRIGIDDIEVSAVRVN